ncbi:MAG: hypothetical protein HW402_915 [Dehalococcoidales bacterium]|nr:hypothetical protein [Dehalococcoidales bacterium]
MRTKPQARKFGIRWPFSGLIPLLMLAHFGHHLLTALTIPLLPMIRSEFHLDYAQAGLVVSAFSLSYGIGQLPAGWITDRVGSRVMLSVGIVGVAVVGVLLGLSHTYLLLIVFLVLMGLMGGGYHPGSAKMIWSSVEPDKRGRALGFHMVGGSASFFLAPIIAAAIAATWGWRGSFIGLAIPTLAFGIFLYVVLGRAGMKEDMHTTTVTASESSPVKGYLRRLVPLLILVNVFQSILSAVLAFVPLYLVDHFGISQGAAAASIAFVYSAGLWASPLGGYLSDRLGMLSVILTAAFLAAPVLYLLNIAPQGLGISALLVVIGTIMYIYTPAAQAYVVKHSPERHRATILGIYFFGNMEGAGVVTPLVGILINRSGFVTAFTVASAVLFVVVLTCSLFLRSNRRASSPVV